ncbi:hypothetical protein FRB94_010379 [Tulasnella sp. JGI-2019a]|nr:hypothetical protein FRB94_010379 [Tulasnella sp. JGI-2019a]
MSGGSDASNGSDNEDITVWAVKRILAESRSKGYKVDWEGTDPQTGKPWAPTWVKRSDCTKPLIEEWNKRKRMNREKAKSIKKPLSASRSLMSEPRSSPKSQSPETKLTKSIKRTYSNRRKDPLSSRTIKKGVSEMDEEETDGEEAPPKRRKVELKTKTIVKGTIISKATGSSVDKVTLRQAPSRSSNPRSNIMATPEADAESPESESLAIKASTSLSKKDGKKRLDPPPPPSPKPAIGFKSFRDAFWKRKSVGSLQDSQDVQSSPAPAITKKGATSMSDARFNSLQIERQNAVPGPSSRRSAPGLVNETRAKRSKAEQKRKSPESNADEEETEEEEEEESRVAKKPPKLSRSVNPAQRIVAEGDNTDVHGHFSGGERSPSLDWEEAEIDAALNDGASSRSGIGEDSGRVPRGSSSKASSVVSLTRTKRLRDLAASRTSEKFSIVLREPSTSTLSLMESDEDTSLEQSATSAHHKSGPSNPRTFVQRVDSASATGVVSMKVEAPSPSQSLPPKLRGSSVSTSHSRSVRMPIHEVYVEIPARVVKKKSAASPSVKAPSAVSTRPRQSSEKIGGDDPHDQQDDPRSLDEEIHRDQPPIQDEAGARPTFGENEEVTAEVETGRANDTRLGADQNAPSQPEAVSTQQSNEGDHSKGTIVPDSQPPQQKSSQSQPTKSQEEAQKQLLLQRSKSNPLNLMTVGKKLGPSSSAAVGPGKRRFASAMPLVKPKDVAIEQGKMETVVRRRSAAATIIPPSSSSPSSVSAISTLPRPAVIAGKPLGPVPNITPSKFRIISNITDNPSPSNVSQIDDSPTRPPLPREKDAGTEPSSKGEGSSQIQTTTQESEETDFSGSRLRPRNWESVGFKDRYLEQENGKKRKPLTEWLGSTNNAVEAEKRDNAPDSPQAHLDEDDIQDDVPPAVDLGATDPPLSGTDQSSESVASLELLQQRDQEISDLKAANAQLQTQLVPLQDKYDDLSKQKAGLDADLDFFRAQYSQASVSAAQLANQNRELEQANKILRNQATTGVRQVRVTLEAEVSSWKESLRREREAKMLLIEQARRSNVRLDIGEGADSEMEQVEVTGDELRQRAAEWYRLSRRYDKLEKDYSDSLERSERLVAILGEAGDNADRASRRLREITAEKEVIQTEKDTLSTELDRLRAVVEDLKDVYVCQWVVDSKNVCAEEFIDAMAFNNHVREHHCSEEALPETIPSIEG